MTHRIATAFRRALLPALLLLLPVAASAFATSQAPVIAPTRSPGTGGIAGGPGAPRPQESGEEEPEEARDPSGMALSSASSGPVSISIVPSPFISVASGDQIVREFTVRNDSANDIDVSIIMPFRIDSWRDEAMRTVSTSRRVPARSVQTIQLFVPTNTSQEMSRGIEVVNPKIYVNRRPFRPPAGIFNSGDIKRNYYSLPNTFSTNEQLVQAILIAFHNSSVSSSSYSDTTLLFSDSDTIQWPAIPQFYQAKNMLFRKTTDRFTPDAERAMHDRNPTFPAVRSSCRADSDAPSCWTKAVSAIRCLPVRPPRIPTARTKSRITRAEQATPRSKT